MGNSTLPTVIDKLNVMASIHNRKLIIRALAKDLKQKDSQIEELKQNITSLEDKLSNLSAKMKHREEHKEKQKQES